MEHKSENPIRPLEGWWSASLFFKFFGASTFAIGSATILKLFGCKFSDFGGEINSQNSNIYILARFLFMVQVGSQKYIRVFKFLFSYFVNQLIDDLHLSHMTKVGGKKTNTHTHTHTKRWANLFFLIRIWQIPLLPPSPQSSKISRIFN